MSSFKITKQNLHDIANLIDSKRGNNNGKLDTQEEYSLFAQDLEKRGYKPQNYNGTVKDLVNEYITNPEKIAAQFAQNGINEKNREKHELFTFLNPDFKDTNRKYTVKEIDDIVNGVATSVGLGSGFLWLGMGTDEDKLKEFVGYKSQNKDDKDDKDVQGKIHKDNVLQVLDRYKEKHKESLAYAIDDDTSGDLQNGIGTVLITALLEKAHEVGVNVSSIVAPSQDSNGEDIKYVVVNVKGVKSGESATADDVFEKVVDALEEKIKRGMSIAAGDEDAIKENKTEALLMFAGQADTDGNGHLQGEEVINFKRLCAGVGIVVNDILAAMKGKNENSYTEEEQAIKNIFSDAGYGAAYAQESKTNAQVNNIETAIADDDEGTLDNIVNLDNINSGNVEDILSKIDDEYEEMYTHVTPGAGAYIGSYKTSTLRKLVARDSKYAAVIIQALVEKADENGVDYDDIIKANNGNFVTASAFATTGEDATKAQYAYDVITKLRERIANESNQERITELMV